MHERTKRPFGGTCLGGMLGVARTNDVRAYDIIVLVSHCVAREGVRGKKA